MTLTGNVVFLALVANVQATLKTKRLTTLAHDNLYRSYYYYHPHSSPPEPECNSACNEDNSLSWSEKCEQHTCTACDECGSLYLVTKDWEESCPPGSVALSAAKCEAAALTMRKKWWYSVEDQLQPGGCSYAHDLIVTFNQIDGTGNKDVHLVCEVVPTPPPPTRSRKATPSPTPSPTPADLYAWGKANTDECPEGYVSILNEIACYSALQNVDYRYGGTADSQFYPTGCVFTIGLGGIFNKHTAGGLPKSGKIFKLCVDESYHPSEAEATDSEDVAECTHEPKCKAWCHKKFRHTWSKKCGPGADGCGWNKGACLACPQCTV